MNLFNFIFLNDFQPDPYLYNCTGRNYQETPRPFIGTYFLVSGILLISIYIPCLIIIVLSDLINHASYKLMFYLGILDIYSLICNSVVTGYLAIIGSNFCTFPKSIFIFGAFGVGCWNGSCLTCLTLTLLRCCDLNPDLKLKFLFKGYYLVLVFCFIISYTLYSSFFIRPGIFNTKYMGWFFDPFIGLDTNNYTNLTHTINNFIDIILIITLYLYLCYQLYSSTNTLQDGVVAKARSQIFIQSIFICSFNTCASLIYVFMQFHSFSPYLILFAQLVWQWSHGSVAIVYITVNHNVRDKLVTLFKVLFKFRPNRVIPNNVIAICQNEGSHVDFTHGIAHSVGRAM